MKNTETSTVAAMLKFGQTTFESQGIHFGHGTTCAWDEAVCLLSFALDLPPSPGRSVLAQVLSMDEQLKIKALFERRISERIPAPYLTGQAWFCGLPFIVDQRVIVPRSPIGALIGERFQPWCKTQPIQILDLCTGGGCIGIACAYAFQDAQIVLTDISADAIAVATMNIAGHDVGDRVTAVVSDLFAGLDSEKRFDLIVSNPPYVDLDDLASMPEEYQYEPALALASGNDGLDFTRRLLREAEHYLTQDGVLVVEVGNSSQALGLAFPMVPFVWIDFDEGDGGVFMLTREELVEHRESFQ
jgi:ribosomal protein L3 glutamine methyltransferase|tara:strand:+ start:640 stop:1542 length:903 start_codon:yes stop_codon:yes gene_type:complete